MPLYGSFAVAAIAAMLGFGSVAQRWMVDNAELVDDIKHQLNPLL